MLPRNGFFKNIQCPYNKANLCHRPYCHYKHNPSGYSEDKKLVVSSSYLGDEAHASYSSSILNDQDDDRYIPIAQPIIRKPASILKVSNSHMVRKSSPVPEYKPTPISKLKELNIPTGDFSASSYSPEYIGPVRRKKHIEEYDPTEIKCIPKKSVTFADETSGGSLIHESTFSSDDDFDDSANAAKFSDDDMDENDVEKTTPPSFDPPNATDVASAQKIEVEEEEESDLDDKKIDEFSLVDKILIETKRNEKLLTFRKKETVLAKPVAPLPKVPLILKGAKVKETISKNKNITNNDIYNMEDDSQNSIPDYSAFDSLRPPVEIESAIKSKYDKKTFDSTIPTYNSPQQIENDKSDTPPDDFQLDSDNFLSTKSSDEQSKQKKASVEIKDMQTKNKEKKKVSEKGHVSKNDKKSAKSHDNKEHKNSKSVETKKLTDKIKNSEKHSKNSIRKTNDKKIESSSKTSDPKSSSDKKFSKSKDSFKKVSVNSKDILQKPSDKSKESNKKIEEKSKHKNSSNDNEKSSKKHKSSSKEKSNAHHHSSKQISHTLSKNLVSSSNEVELQDGKVSSSCVEKKNPIGVTSSTSKSNASIPSRSKHDSVNLNHTKKPFKRKNKSSDSESNSEKEHSKSKLFKKLKTENVASSFDENSDNEISSETYSTKKKSGFKKKRNDLDSTSDSDSDIAVIETYKPEKTKLKNNSFPTTRKQRNTNVSSMDEDIIISSDSDSVSDPNEECWKIYNEEFNDVSDDNSGSIEKQDSSKKLSDYEDVSVLKKKRFAHAAAASLTKPKFAANKNVRQPINPGQVMHSRYAQIMKARQESMDSKVQEAQGSHLAAKTGKRIAVSPNNSLLAAICEKKKLAQTVADFSPLPSTVSKTLKPSKRVAHVPDLVSKPRPIIPAEYGSKVPTNIRQKFLNAFIDEYLKFTSTENEAFDEALEEEKKAYQRSSSKAIYMNVASNTLARLRHKNSELSETKKNEGVSSTTNKKSSKSVSHEKMLNGPMAQRNSFSIEKKKPPPVPELKGAALYEYLLTYALSEDQLRENGFPIPHPTESGRVVIEGVYANKSRYCNDQFKRTCSRCQKVYYVNVDGDYVRDEECDFHWGRLWKRRIAGMFESRYNCCQGDAESDGCCVSTGHVFEGSESHALKGFIKTLPKSPPPDKYYGIYALDCEMCYTTAGMELTRVTVVGPDSKPVYETFVKPCNKVLDFNTRFSGITEDDLKSVRTTLRDVQAVLLCMFNNRTILIGHSLESDFKALKLIHNTVVDTSVVFPHKIGLPYKRALKTLMAEKLNKIIQNEVGGHDSQEDAVACMELMLWKIKEDLKGNR